MARPPEPFDSDLLYNLATACEELFDTVISACSALKHQHEEQWTECQQRFSIWASQLGVFARRNQSLDARLRKVPDVQDLVARLLEILRRTLSQFSRAQVASQQSGDGEPRQDTQQSALVTVDETLTRLSRLAGDIRAASRSRVNVKIQEFSSRLDLLPLQDMAQAAVESLYPSSHDALKIHLSKGMVEICARIRYWEHRQGKLNTRRPVADTAPRMETIEEDAPATTLSPDMTSKQPIRGPVAQLRQSGRVPQNLPSQSDPSTINTQQMRRFMNRHLGVGVPTEQRKTSSVQVQQANYPRPYVPEASNLLQCEWCSELFHKKQLSESDWRRHIDKDLKPYRCMSENCPEAHPSFGSFSEWLSHMTDHSRRWYQRVFLTEGWSCPVCEFEQIYTSPTDLLPHLQLAHSDQFDTDQLHAVSRQGVVVRPRRWNECAVCSFTVEEALELNNPEHPKRQGGHLDGVSAKMARTSLETGSSSRHAGNTSVAAEASSSDSDMDSSDSDDRVPVASKLHNATVMARHIAAHHQVLMLLTIRLAALLNSEDDFDDNEGANSVDISGSIDQSGTADIGRVASLASGSTCDGPDDDLTPTECGFELVPDTAIDLRRLLDGDEDYEIPDVSLGEGAKDIPGKLTREERQKETRRMLAEIQAELEREKEKAKLHDEAIHNDSAQQPRQKDGTESYSDPIQEEADRRYREMRMSRAAAEEEIEAGRRRQEEDDSGPILERIPLPPDGPNADVRIDNVILPRDEFRYRATKYYPSPVAGNHYPGPLYPIFKSRDPSAERERPMINLIIPTPYPSPRGSPVLAPKTREPPPEPDRPDGSDSESTWMPMRNIFRQRDSDGDHEMEDAPDAEEAMAVEVADASGSRPSAAAAPAAKKKKRFTWGELAAALDPDNTDDHLFGDGD
ncbi:hypothetical protein QBC47DRAFT_189683 [Echria macrotheca]|uniref:C2H2-type domain-containing protein n=1 Tax=Echria macrotheca TaxID=438768 RepID=A0AAJ0BBX5_9PEZI|nr:hypothetical protein QBC47DRAFT_189683 [Echria macrotheca]